MLAKQQQLPGRDNPLFGQAMTHLEQLGPHAGGYLDPVQMEQVAGAVACQARLHQLPRIDELTPVQDGRALLATSTDQNPWLIDRVLIDKLQATTQPLGAEPAAAHGGNAAAAGSGVAPGPAAADGAAATRVLTLMPSLGAWT
ncbi:XVIPCD domain-containing protein [Xanthomonas axonopodis pv. vasculorum]